MVDQWMLKAFVTLAFVGCIAGLYDLCLALFMIMQPEERIVVLVEGLACAVIPTCLAGLQHLLSTAARRSV